MLLREQLSNDCAGIILDAVKSESGRLRFISEESKINRKYLTRKTFRTLRWFRLVRVLYCLAMKMGRMDFRKLGANLFDEIWEMADSWGYELLDERKSCNNGLL